MSKSAASKVNYAARRDLRLRRDKAATALLAALLNGSGSLATSAASAECVRNAVRLADELLVELDRTRPDLKGEGAESPSV